MTDEEKKGYAGNEKEGWYKTQHEEYVKIKTAIGDENAPGTLLYEQKQLNAQLKVKNDELNAIDAERTPYVTNATLDNPDFGFTEKEIEKLLAYYGMSEKENELRDWYDGYLFGNEEIYNPWSVINYIAKGCTPQAYWVNTGKNEVLEDVLKIATDDITQKLYSLLQGESVIARIHHNYF